MEYPEDLLYTEDHHWILEEGDTVTIGLSDQVQVLLEEVVSVNLPEVGDILAIGSPMAVVESTNGVLDVCAPLSGEIIEVNDGLADSPEWVHISPYEDGWLVRMKLAEPGELKEMLAADDYREFVEEG
jgi:glycine cleavage system H protein